MLKKNGRDLKSGCVRWYTFSVGNYFPHDIIIFPLNYKIEKIYSQLTFSQHEIYL